MSEETKCPDGFIPVYAREKMNDTGFDLVAGKRYSFYATGEWTDWYEDPCDANGVPGEFPKNTINKLRRKPDANWFCLIGEVDGTDFIIGTGCEYKAEKSGRLCCYANDLSPMYWNNKGHVCLQIVKVD